MAKSIVLYGVLFGAFICLCGYFAGVGIGVRYEALGDSFESSAVSYQPLDLRNFVGSVGGRISSVLTGSTSALSDLRSFAWPCVVENSASLKKLGLGSEEVIKRARHDLQKIYSAEIGVREATGKNDGQRVEEYLAATQLGKGYAWCASFISWVFAEAGFSQPRTPWSPALFPKERVIWERGKVARDQTSTVILSETQWSRKISPLTAQTTRLAKLSLPAFSQKISPLRFTSVEMTNGDIIPKPADVFGIYFTNLKRIAHVGFVDEWGEKYVITVEGNTNEAGSNEGDGVYKKRRLISSIYQVSDWVKGQERRME